MSGRATTHFPMNFFSRFFLRTPIFSEVESRILKEVEDALSSVSRLIFAAQAAKIIKIQRLDRGREVDFYFATMDGIPLFQEFSSIDEFKIASVHLRSTDSGHQADACVWLVKGRLFSIGFNAPPRDLKGEKLLAEVVLHIP
jgi:hypothetical protein